jgi:hypothetical protein
VHGILYIRISFERVLRDIEKNLLFKITGEFCRRPLPCMRSWGTCEGQQQWIYLGF